MIGSLVTSYHFSGRMLHNNVILVQDLVHNLNRRTKGNNVVMKRDMLRHMIGCNHLLLFRCCSALGF